MYKLKQEYLTYTTCDNTDEDIITELRCIAEDIFGITSQGMKIDLQVNEKGNGYGYILGDMVTFEESGCGYIKFKVYGSRG